MTYNALSNPLIFEKIVDCMGDGLFVLDNNGKIVFSNRSMEKITGYAPDEIEGKFCDTFRCRKCFGMDCSEGVGSCGIFDKGGEMCRECTIQHKDGFEVPVIKNCSVIKDAKGRILGAVETVTDLTALQQMRLRLEEAERINRHIDHFDNILGKSDSMQLIYSLIQSAAASDVTVLIEGESGTGKELIASAIHKRSARKDAPMVTVNCTALSENLLESELFGHVNGAFTGAVKNRIGRFEVANKGTVFFDEIGEISPYIQIKLLRVLQEREICRVGENQNRRIDIRVIAATNQYLYDLVKMGKFRSDLYYRLKVLSIRIPSLCDRKQDIPLLADHFLKQNNEKDGKKRILGISSRAIECLLNYPWPGNVRELENAIECAFVLCDQMIIQAENLPIEIREFANLPPRSIEKTMNRNGRRRKKPDKQQLVKLLEEMDWNKTEVARRLALSRTSIWKYMKKFDIPLKPPEVYSPDND